MGRNPHAKPPPPGEKRTPEKKEEALEEALDESFPASDPPAVTSPTRSITGDDEVVKKPPPAEQTGDPSKGKEKDR